MPTYSYVNWQPDDEVSSSKLKQMADNEQLVFDTLIQGDISYKRGANNQSPAGRTVGTVQAKRIEGYYVPFSNNPPVPRYLVQIPYNNVFTFPPIITITVKSLGNSDLCVQLVDDYNTTRATCIVFRRDGAAVAFGGGLNCIVLGY